MNKWTLRAPDVCASDAFETFSAVAGELHGNDRALVELRVVNGNEGIEYIIASQFSCGFYHIRTVASFVIVKYPRQEIEPEEIDE